MNPLEQLMKPPKCELCGTTHWPDGPHDPTTIDYQSWFERHHGRRPTWNDALSHCDDNIRAAAIVIWNLYQIDPTKPADMAWPKPKEL